MTTLRERLAQILDGAEVVWAEDVTGCTAESGVVLPRDVAAALVAVADAAARNQEPTSTEAAPDADMVALGAIVGKRWDEMRKALDALAAALGVSR